MHLCYNSSMKNKFYALVLLTSFCIGTMFNSINAESKGGKNTFINNNQVLGPHFDTSIKPLPIASSSNVFYQISEEDIWVHDGIRFIKGESLGTFKLSGYCACKKCSTGTGITYSGKKVRENHTVAADLKVLPLGTYIILEGKKDTRATRYTGVYQVEDKGGGVKNNHIDIYLPTHELASGVTYHGRAYGDVYIAIPIDKAPE